MSDVKPVAPRVPQALQTAGDLLQLLRKDVTVTALRTTNQDLQGIHIKSCVTQEVHFEKVNFSAATLEATSFLDTEILNCTFVTSALSDASWQRVLVADSLCTGLQLQTSLLKDVVFRNCKLNLTNFRFTKCQRVLFVDSDLTEADFYNAELTDVAFQNCILHKTQLSGVKLTRVDFRGSDIRTILGVNSLRGAIIDSVQLAELAPLLAAELQIHVQDE